MTTPSPHELRKEWRFYSRESSKQRVLADVLERFVAAIDGLRKAGLDTALSYATPDVVDEALRDGITFFRTSELMFAQLGQDAHDAFNAAAQQN